MTSSRYSDLGAFRLGGVLKYFRLKTEPEVHRCGEFNLIGTKTIRISSIGEFGFWLRGVDLYMPFRFQKQARIHGRELNIIITDAMVNKCVKHQYLGKRYLGKRTMN